MTYNHHTHNPGNSNPSAPITSTSTKLTAENAKAKKEEVKELNSKLQEIKESVESGLQELQKLLDELSKKISHGKGQKKRTKIYNDAQPTISELAKLEGELKGFNDYLNQLKIEGIPEDYLLILERKAKGINQRLKDYIKDNNIATLKKIIQTELGKCQKRNNG